MNIIFLSLHMFRSSRRRRPTDVERSMISTCAAFSLTSITVSLLRDY